MSEKENTILQFYLLPYCNARKLSGKKIKQLQKFWYILSEKQACLFVTITLDITCLLEEKL